MYSFVVLPIPASGKESSAGIRPHAHKLLHRSSPLLSPESGQDHCHYQHHDVRCSDQHSASDILHRMSLFGLLKACEEISLTTTTIAKYTGISANANQVFVRMSLLEPSESM